MRRRPVWGGADQAPALTKFRRVREPFLPVMALAPGIPEIPHQLLPLGAHGLGADLLTASYRRVQIRDSLLCAIAPAASTASGVRPAAS